MNVTAPVPEWLNKDFFEKIIRKKENDLNAKVSELVVGPGSKPGENFGSSLYRAFVEYTSKYTAGTKQLSLIIKIKPDLSAWPVNYLEHSPDLFKTEMAMYGRVLPQIQSLLLSANDKSTMFPQLVYQSNEPAPVIVLEDLSVQDFNTINKPPVDFEESKKIVRRLAKFHAANVHIEAEQLEDYSEYNQFVFQNATIADLIFGQGIGGFTDVAREWEGYEKYIPKLEHLKETYLESFKRIYKKNDKGYNVLNHGDFHIRNMLFKHDDAGAIEDMYFIDFQTCICATPAIDLIYAMYFMLSSENRINHRDEFIATYHNEYVATLKKLGSLKAPPSLTDLQVELMRNGALEPMIAICMTLAFYIDFSTLTPADFDADPETQDRLKKRLYNNPDFKAMIDQEMPRFLTKGFI
ncbi:unnamed protein product [Diamesa serratosioi]